jgi:hypothetical protein
MIELVLRPSGFLPLFFSYSTPLFVTHCGLWRVIVNGLHFADSGIMPGGGLRWQSLFDSLIL